MTSSASSPPNSVVHLRPIATPLSLGFLALAVISFVVAGDELSWISDTAQGHLVALATLVFVVPLQAGCAVFGFLARDPAAAAGLGVMSGTWAAYGAVGLMSPPGTRSGALGLLLCAAAAALIVPAAASFSGKVVAGAVLLIAGARFALTGVYELTGSHLLRDVSGVVGLVVCGVALYAALAFELEGIAGRTVLPIGRHGRGDVAIRGNLDEQLRQVENEPGVRRPL